MFEPNSRYYLLDAARLTTPDGEEIVYKRRRFLPQGARLPLLVEVKVTQGERLDNITARTLGDPLQFWRVCDANDALNPLELTAEPGSVVRVSIPQF